MWSTKIYKVYLYCSLRFPLIACMWKFVFVLFGEIKIQSYNPTAPTPWNILYFFTKQA